MTIDSVTKTVTLRNGKAFLRQRHVKFISLSPCTEAVSFLFALKWVLATSTENSFVQNAYYDLQKSGTATETTQEGSSQGQAHI